MAPKTVSEEAIIATLKRMHQLIYSPQSEAVIHQVQNKDIVIFLGNTRSGKSTVVNYVIGNTLKATCIRKRNFNIVKENESSDGPKIGEGAVSETTIPTKWNSRRITGLIVDAPGFDDNRGESQDVANAFYIKELLRNARSVKFVLVSDINDILIDNIGQFISFIDKIHVMLPQSEKLHPGMAIVFTKDKEDTTKNEMCSYFSKKILVQGDIAIKNRSLISYLSRNSGNIEILRMPEQEGSLAENDAIFGNLITLIENGLAKLSGDLLTGVTPGISEKSKCFLLEAHTYFTELREFSQVLAEANAAFANSVTEYRLSTDTGMEKVVEVKNQLKGLEKNLNNIIESSLPMKDLLLKLSTFVPNVSSLKEHSSIYTKLTFVEFVDSVLQVDESTIFRVRLVNLLSEMKERVACLYIAAQEQSLEISKAEAAEKMERAQKQHEQQMQESSKRLEELEKRNAQIIEELKEAKRKRGFFAQLGSAIDSVFF